MTYKTEKQKKYYFQALKEYHKKKNEMSNLKHKKDKNIKNTYKLIKIN